MTLLKIIFDTSAVNEQAWTIFFVGWLVVFFSLITLSSIFRLLPILFFNKENKEAKISKPKKEIITEKSNDNNEEINAAIGYALYSYFNQLHDDEARVLTINREVGTQSAWNSKVYNVIDSSKH